MTAQEAATSNVKCVNCGHAGKYHAQESLYGGLRGKWRQCRHRVPKRLARVGVDECGCTDFEPPMTKGDLFRARVRRE